MTGAAVDPAAAYDAWYATRLGAAAHRIELALVLELALPDPGERVLDAGCGTGIYSALLSERGLEVTGLDPDPHMLAAARLKAPVARLVEGDVTRLPFADAEFDLALAVTLLCFLGDEEREHAARELLRVVRPGGRVVIGELARFSLWAAQRRVKGFLGSAWRSARFTTAAELVRLFDSAGAARLVSRYGLYLPPLDWAPLARRADAIERIGRRRGPLGAAFVAVRANLPDEGHTSVVFPQ